MKRIKFINWIKYKLWVWQFNNNLELCPICGDKIIGTNEQNCRCNNQWCDFNKMK